MKNKFIFLIASISFVTILGCGATNDGQECADTFFDYMVQEQYDSAVYMLNNGTEIDTNSIHTLQNFGNNSNLGKLISAKKKFGFNTQISNGITTVQLPYKMIFEEGKRTANVTIIDRGNGYNIESVDF